MKIQTQIVKRWAAGIMLVFALLAGGSQSVLAQDATPGATAVTTTTVQDNRKDDGFPWGLLGLLGLAGLAGLRPHKHEIERVDRTPNTRP